MKSDPCQPELLQSWFDGEATDFEAARMRAHAAACPECAERISAWRTLRASTAGLHASSPSPAVWARIEARLAAPARRRWGGWELLTAAAALAMAIWLSQLLGAPDYPAQGWDGIALGTAEPSGEWLATQLPQPEAQFQVGPGEAAR